MFKQINEKKCGLCPNPQHTFEGNIQTKSELFRKLNHSESELQYYLLEMKKEQTRSI